MKKRLDNLVIARSEKKNPDTESENIKADILRIENEICKLMDKLADADNILFEYIQKRVQKLHTEKSNLEDKLRAKARKHKEIDTTPLSDPMNRWDSLSIEKKHDLAATMIDVVYVSDEQGIENEFSI